MAALGKKEKELMDYLETIIHRFVFTKEQPGMDVCRKPEIKIIEILGKKGPMIMTEIADQAFLSLSTVTGIMDSLVAKSLAQRERSEEDRRVVRVALTAEGRKIYDEAVEVHSAVVRGMLGALKKNEQDILVGLFRKIVEKIEKEKKDAVMKGGRL